MTLTLSVAHSVVRFQLVSVTHPTDLTVRSGGEGLAPFGTLYRTLDGVEGDRQSDIVTEDSAAKSS